MPENPDYEWPPILLTEEENLELGEKLCEQIAKQLSTKEKNYFSRFSAKELVIYQLQQNENECVTPESYRHNFQLMASKKSIQEQWTHRHEEKWEQTFSIAHTHSCINNLNAKYREYVARIVTAKLHRNLTLSQVRCEHTDESIECIEQSKRILRENYEKILHGNLNHLEPQYAQIENEIHTIDSLDSDAFENLHKAIQPALNEEPESYFIAFRGKHIRLDDTKIASKDFWVPNFSYYKKYQFIEKDSYTCHTESASIGNSYFDIVAFLQGFDTLDENDRLEIAELYRSTEIERLEQRLRLLEDGGLTEAYLNYPIIYKNPDSCDES